MAALEFLHKHAPATMNLMKSIPVSEWAGQPELMNLESQYGFGSSGLPSIARHTAGMSNLSDTFASALALDKNNPGRISQFFGDVGAFGLGALNEIPGTYRGLTGSQKDASESWEDIKANIEGTFKTPFGTTSEDIYKDVYAGKYDHLLEEKGTIDVSNPQVNLTGLGIMSGLNKLFGPKIAAYLKNKALQQGIGLGAQKLRHLRQAQMQEKIRKAEAAAAANARAQRRAGKGGSHMSRGRDQGGLGITSQQAQQVSDANKAAGMSGWGL